jgi:eukaryotic-like serine/threonine-protein kinase
MTTPDMPRRTLLDCLAEGKLSLSEALGHAVVLAQELCRIHAAGRAHGALSPAAIVVADSGLELLPALSAGEVTPYTAPELLAGAPGDALSDIFSFGAVVYEMVAGRRAFEGDTPEALAEAIAASQPPSCGGAALDRLIQTCLAKDPGTRFQRMDKVLMELQLSATAARSGRLPAMNRWEAADAQLRTELYLRLEVHEKKLAELEQRTRTEHAPETAMRDVQHSLGLQAVAIDSMRADLKRQEDLVTWVVELLEELQSNNPKQ